MERNFVFQPPPFLGSGFRQNHQIRALKSNSIPFVASHRSYLTPSGSHTSPSLSLLTSRTTPDFSRTNLTSHRRRHLRRCYDLFHLSMQRRNFTLAGKFLKVLMGAHEWSSHLLWQWALVLCADRLGYVQQLDLEASSAFKAAYTTEILVGEYVAARRINDAVELLEQRVNVWPYKGRPELHVCLGMLYLYVGISAVLSGGEGELRALDRSTRGKARMCFETAIQATEGWRRGEVGKRQRIYGVWRGEKGVDEARVVGKREKVWGEDVMAGWGEVEEHESLKRVRRRLDGEEEEERREEESEGDTSSASGSLYSGNDSSNHSSEDEPRGRPQTRSPPQPDLAPAHPAAPAKGPKAWSNVWPTIAPIYTPAPPFAHHLARSFLTFLAAPSTTLSASQGEQREDDSDVEVVGGVELTREEAELRLRRILFEGETEGSAGRSERVKKERGREAKHTSKRRRDERRRRH